MTFSCAPALITSWWYSFPALSTSGSPSHLYCPTYTTLSEGTIWCQTSGSHLPVSLCQSLKWHTKTWPIQGCIHAKMFSWICHWEHRGIYLGGPVTLSATSASLPSTPKPAAQMFQGVWIFLVGIMWGFPVPILPNIMCMHEESSEWQQQCGWKHPGHWQDSRMSWN